MYTNYSMIIDQYNTRAPPTNARVNNSSVMSKRAPSPIPVVTVTARSPPDTWHRLEEAIDSADFISLDLVNEVVHSV